MHLWAAVCPYSTPLTINCSQIASAGLSHWRNPILQKVSQGFWHGPWLGSQRKWGKHPMKPILRDITLSLPYSLSQCKSPGHIQGTGDQTPPLDRRGRQVILQTVWIQERVKIRGHFLHLPYKFLTLQLCPVNVQNAIWPYTRQVLSLELMKKWKGDHFSGHVIFKKCVQ